MLLNEMFFFWSLFITLVALYPGKAIFAQKQKVQWHDAEGSVFDDPDDVNVEF